jgi:hypothetical protein
LNADKRDQASLAAKLARDAIRANAGVGFVESGDDEFGIVAEDAAALGLEREAVEDGEGVRRNRGAEPLDDVAVVVVMRWLDQY